MERFRNLIIREKVIKVPNQMEALRIFNYPYQAIEEAVVNAFYHRDYMFYEPVTIEIEHDCINIMNFPGIDRSYFRKDDSWGKTICFKILQKQTTRWILKRTWFIWRSFFRYPDDTGRTWKEWIAKSRVLYGWR